MHRRMFSHLAAPFRRLSFRPFLILLLATGAVLPVRLAAAEEAAAPGSERVDEMQPVPDTTGVAEAETKQDESPVRLHRALRERGVGLGYGENVRLKRFEHRSDSRMFQLIPAKGRFRNTTQEFIWEAPLVVFTEPHTDFLAGVTLMFRQHLTSNRRFAPYLEIGAGANLTDLDIPEIGGRFQFSLQGGAGIRKAVGRNSDLTIGLRWYHLSNGGIRRPNTGLNNYLITVGYSHLT